MPLDEVEPVEAIVTRFSGGAMSHGSLSAEAHETIAIALNRLGGKSNSGEGGEDPSRYGTERSSRIKQIASARFGVTAAYAVSRRRAADQGRAGLETRRRRADPGHKVTEEIARLRNTQPGVSLISPPPHHDIYSIEDLAQLIFDLREVNPDADISVKLVSETGVGLVAVGVAKAHAHVIHVAGSDGGRAPARCRRSSMPARRGSSVSPRRSRRSSTRACADGYGSASTGASRPDETSSSRRCSVPTSTRSARRC